MAGFDPALTQLVASMRELGVTRYRTPELEVELGPPPQSPPLAGTLSGAATGPSLEEIAAERDLVMYASAS